MSHVERLEHEASEGPATARQPRGRDSTVLGWLYPGGYPRKLRSSGVYQESNQLLRMHSTPRLHLARMAWAGRTIRKRIPVQCDAPQTQAEQASVPRYASQ